MLKRSAARSAAFAVLALLLAVLAAACGGAAVPEPASGSLEFSNAWSAPQPEGA